MGNLAVITARSGSKGLKDKNIRWMNGKPLLAYSIETALRSKLFNVVHVSTDSEHYANIARKYGADVPFLRSEELSEDHSDSWDVLRFVVEQYEKIGKKFDTVTLLQPTSPLRTVYDICEAFKIYNTKQAENVFSVCEVKHDPFWCNTIPPDGSLNHFISPEEDGRRQDFPRYYALNGAIYIISTELLMKKGNVYGSKSYAYFMPRYRSIDIDDEYDFLIAEILSEKHCDSETFR